MTLKPKRVQAKMTARRAFLWTMAAAPAAFAAGIMLLRVRARRAPRDVAIPADVPVGLSVAGDVIVNRETSGVIHVFAARCTHLGCRLERIVDGEIQCPCHGSRFAADGSVLAGPAIRPLDRLKTASDAQTGGWFAHAD